MKQIKQQKSSQEMWINEDGQAIPFKRVTKFERNTERETAKMAKTACDLNERLTAFKSYLRKTAEDLLNDFIEENGGKKLGKGKGGITLFNFDRSIKVEVSINDSIVFDDNLISLAKQKLDEVLEDSLQSAKDFIKPIVMDAFSTTTGKLDTKRVLGLRRHAANVKDERYQEAMELIDKSIRKPKSKEYYRIWVLNAQGKYEDVQLNFSAI